MLKAGIIGLGVGEQHIAGYERHPNCQVIAICDFDPQKKAMAKAKYPHLEFYEQASDLLRHAEIDLVSIASYDTYHHSQILQAIDHNIHVFVEKPLCLSIDEAREIRQQFQVKPHLKLSSNLILRKSPRFIELKQAIQQGDFGQLYYLEGDYNYGRLHKLTEGWRGKEPFYSVTYGGGIHLIDLLMWLSEDSIEEVTACGNRIATANTPFQYNDLMVSLLKFKSGLLGKVSANFACVHPHFHQLQVYGTEATFINQMKEAKLYKKAAGTTECITMNSAYPGAHKGDLIYSFIDAILNHHEPEVTKDDVFNSMSVCLAIEAAIEAKQSVKVQYV